MKKVLVFLIVVALLLFMSVPAFAVLQPQDVFPVGSSFFELYSSALSSSSSQFAISTVVADNKSYTVDSNGMLVIPDGVTGSDIDIRFVTNIFDPGFYSMGVVMFSSFPYSDLEYNYYSSFPGISDKWTQMLDSFQSPDSLIASSFSDMSFVYFDISNQYYSDFIVRQIKIRFPSEVDISGTYYLIPVMDFPFVDSVSPSFPYYDFSQAISDYDRYFLFPDAVDRGTNELLALHFIQYQIEDFGLAMIQLPAVIGNQIQNFIRPLYFSFTDFFSSFSSSLESSFSVLFSFLDNQDKSYTDAINPDLDDKTNEANQIVEDTENFENDIFTSADNALGEIDIENQKLPDSFSAPFLWIGQLVVALFNQLGDFKIVILFPMYLGLCLLAIGRGGQAIQRINYRGRGPGSDA